MIVLSAKASAVFMISFIFVTYSNFQLALVTYNNLLLGDYLEIFSLTQRLVMG